MEWFESSHHIFSNLKEIMLSAYFERIKKLQDMPREARDIIWWPFTQHKLVPDGGVTVIDSRCGENFSIFKVCFCENLCLLLFFQFVKLCNTHFSGLQRNVVLNLLRLDLLDKLLHKYLQEKKYKKET